MENTSNAKAENFLKNEVLKIENRLFIGKLLSFAIGYTLITLWLNSIRATASLWFVWVLIIIQFALYFSIFIASYQRSKVFGLNKNLAFFALVILAVLGRVNDWEIIVIPATVIVMVVFSLINKKVSDHGQTMLPQK